ncbi:uncharacterized protein LOC110444546 [Mizuhopecten yessoensis]|uniref:uncharacterized protein LOC110444546 n=1 Tax=Mizuhopecten yessoensis TaxID=6573 RepID=UPI000B45BF9E|nr:uncharacterized protein LOC110444546 [Mizuhopecten yessoensis]
MAGNMDRHFDRGNITPSTLAAQMNDVSALEHLLKDKQCFSGMNSKALLVSLENRSMDCVEFLVKRNHVRLDSRVLAMNRDVSHFFNLHKSDPTVKLLKDLITQPSERDFLKLIVDYECFPVYFIVSLCIYLDATETTKFLLESTKANSITKFSKFMNLVTLATLKNSPSLLKVLIRYVRFRHTFHYTVCSPLYWAKMLHYDACVKILEKPLYYCRKQKEINDSDFATVPPFPALLLETNVIEIDLLGIVRKLKEFGYNINAAITTGSSCLNLATDQRNTSASVKKNGTLVSLLLELGADVFATKMYQIRGQGMNPSMLLRMLLANVDISGPQTAELQSSRPQIIMPLVNSEMQLLTLRTAHTICKDDVEFLRTKLKEMTDLEGFDRNTRMYQDLKDHLDEYVDNPQTLRRLCRNFIRRTTGIHLHNFLKGQILPQRLVNILTLKDDLEPYWQSCEENQFWKYGYDH